MFSFKLERDMQKLLVDDAAKIPGEKSVRVVKKSGKWVGLNLRWPIDLKTESPKKKDEAAAISADGDEIEEADAKFSVKKIWCSSEFKPFDILSVDLGVRYAGAWCRGRVKIGRDAGRPTERVISPAGHGQEIVYDAYDFGTFRLQGEDAKIWRKDKHKGFADEPELEKCGSRGRIASEIERAEFAELAERIFPATKRFPISNDPVELKFFPDLADHLTYRLRRRLGRIRFLFKLRWQISGKKREVGHEYKDLAGDELKVFRGEQRFNAIAGLTFIPKENEPEETEDDFMRDLRLNLAPDELWSKLVYEHDGETWPLFAKVKGGHGKDDKEKSKQKKAAQKAAWAKLKIELQSDSSGKWDWNALGKSVETELENAMQAFAGNQSLIAEVARFVWPLQDKKWKWNCCTINWTVVRSPAGRDLPRIIFPVLGGPVGVLPDPLIDQAAELLVVGQLGTQRFKGWGPDEWRFFSTIGVVELIVGAVAARFLGVFAAAAGLAADVGTTGERPPGRMGPQLGYLGFQRGDPFPEFSHGGVCFCFHIR